MCSELHSLRLLKYDASSHWWRLHQVTEQQNIQSAEKFLDILQLLKMLINHAEHLVGNH